MSINDNSGNEKKLIQDETPDVIYRLQEIAQQKFLFDHSKSLEKELYSLLDELKAEFAGVMTDSIADIHAYHKRVFAYSSLAQQKWGAFSQKNINDVNELRQLIASEQMTQDELGTDQANERLTEKENLMCLPEDKAIKMREADLSEMQVIRQLLGDYTDKCSNAWAVENAETQARFTAFLAREGNMHTRLLWHGSGNENWWNIIHSGLSTDPGDVSIMGKMFGQGIYFATTVEKSIYFTSIKRMNQKRRFTNTAFLGIYEVACGVPYDVYTYDPKFATFDAEQLQKVKKGAHCIHAHAGEMLKNEEIVIYKEGQATIRFLVELRQ